jgi:hypothetical protein
MRSLSLLIGAMLVTGCASTSVSEFRAPDGASIKTVKCNTDPTKCFVAASQSCAEIGTYRVLSSESRAGGIAGDVIPGPITWYYMTYACGPSDGRLPDFEFAGQQYVPPPPPRAPRKTNCIAVGNTVDCTTYD